MCICISIKNSIVGKPINKKMLNTFEPFWMQYVLLIQLLMNLNTKESQPSTDL